ncbi:RTA1 like protein-domain-containing protein [Cladorrhinum sp. PSN259]|nr:RTA1 like protein-domain-containing protein [Cladorrhinum sp. PSN259]
MSTTTSSISPPPSSSSSSSPSSFGTSSSVWPYEPVFAPCIVFTAIYALLLLWISYLTFIRYRTFYFTVMPLGTSVEVLGYALRCYAVKNQTQLPPYITSLSLTVLAPLLFSAGNYLLLPRLIVSTTPNQNLNPRTTILKVPTNRLAHLFISLDILAFLIQGAGTSVSGSAKWTGPTALVGVRVLVGGLAVQVLGVGWFLACVVRYRYLERAGMGEEKRSKKSRSGNLTWAVAISGGLILIRSIYRLVEFAEGVDGYVFRSEWLFWLFEAAAMVGCVVVFCFWHPGQLLIDDNNNKPEVVVVDL